MPLGTRRFQLDDTRVGIQADSAESGSVGGLLGANPVLGEELKNASLSYHLPLPNLGNHRLTDCLYCW